MNKSFPPGSFNAHWFNFFNAISFQIVMGAPIIVYAKSLNASSTVLGILASFTPLMTIFQLPAAKHLERHGYRQFMLGGWGLRAVLIFFITAVPVLAFLDDTTKLVTLLAVLFFFNLLRGISSAAWMPWIAALIPEESRGRFLSLDQFFMYGGCLVSVLVSAVLMSGHVDSWEYATVFFFSAIGATISLYFIKSMPEVAASETTRRSSHPVPWGAMLRYPPFLELVIFNLIFFAVIGSLGVFTVEYLREMSHFEVSTVLYLSAFSFIGSLVVLPFCGPLIDQSGSKPFMRIATGLFAVVIGVWCLMAAGVLPGAFLLVCALNFLTGVASANFNLANARITMATMPEMGRNHFFALFTVITSLGLGAAPVMWGMILDALGTYEAVTGVFHWKRHSIYFLALFVLNAIAFACIGRLHETPGAGRAEPSVIYGRLKRLPRIWHR